MARPYDVPERTIDPPEAYVPEFLAIDAPCDAIPAAARRWNRPDASCASKHAEDIVSYGGVEHKLCRMHLATWIARGHDAEYQYALAVAWGWDS